MSWIEKVRPEDAAGPIDRLCDEDLLVPAHVVAFFNDANRLAESLHVDPEPD